MNVECEKLREIISDYSINITHSNNIKSEKNVNYNLMFNREENIIELPACEEDLNILNKIHSWGGSLKKYGCDIIHGKLIITACEENIYNKNENTTDIVPLLWLPNIDTSKFIFPLELNYGQYLFVNEKTSKYVIRNKNYVFLRRYNNNTTNRVIK